MYRQLIRKGLPRHLGVPMSELSHDPVETCARVYEQLLILKMKEILWTSGRGSLAAKSCQASYSSEFNKFPHCHNLVNTNGQC